MNRDKISAIIGLMWILIKIALACIAGFARLVSRHFQGVGKRSPDYIHNGSEIYINTSKSKGGRILQTTFIVEFKSRALFRLSPESRYDRFFKMLGLSAEIQSGDKTFDDNVYIACDHPIFADHVKSNPEMRRLILVLFDAGAHRINYDGRHLTVKLKGDFSTKFDIAHLLADLKANLTNLDMHRPSFWGDPYVQRSLAIEVVIWGLAGYAFSGFLQLVSVRKDYHLYPYPVYLQGLLCGALLAVVLILGTLLIMKGSSRGHRILIECAVVLSLSLPVGGISAVVDLNRELDKSAPVIVEAKVTNVEEVVRRGGRGRRREYFIHLHQLSEASELSLPKRIQVDRSTFQTARIDDFAELHIGRGWLKHPWYRAIHFRRRF